MITSIYHYEDGKRRKKYLLRFIYQVAPLKTEKVVMKRLKVIITATIFLLNLPVYGYILGDIDYNKKWIKLAKTEQESKQMLLQLLANSKSGAQIISQAKRKADRRHAELSSLIIPGRTSITDTTLIRRFSRTNPDQVEYEDRSKVYINSDHNVRDAILDLAHELTHFTYRQAFNPYRDGFSFSSFLKGTIEKKGGEAHAFITECKVLKEMFPGIIYQESKCPSIVDPSTGRFSFKKTVIRFYQVGAYYDQFWTEVRPFDVTKEQFPLISEAQATFISSAYGKPYPVATIQEYTDMMRKVCQNDERRLGHMKQKTTRSPASISSYKKMEKSFFQRCGSIQY